MNTLEEILGMICTDTLRTRRAYPYAILDLLSSDPAANARTADAVRELVAELLETLEDVLNQACQISPTCIDSMALSHRKVTSANEDGLRLLARYGRFVIEKEYGRRVIGHWK